MHYNYKQISNVFSSVHEVQLTSVWSSTVLVGLTRSSESQSVYSLNKSNCDDTKSRLKLEQKILIISP